MKSLQAQSLNDFILKRNSHKVSRLLFLYLLLLHLLQIKEYERLDKWEDNSKNFTESLERKILSENTEKQNITSRRFSQGEKKLYQEILLSSVEYFDLFVVNRPVQTLPGEISVIKEIERNFKGLLEVRDLAVI